MARYLFVALACGLSIAVAAPVTSAAPKTVTAPKTGNAPTTDKGKGTTSNQKKPGKTCNDLGPGSQAFKDCIQTQAHEGQTGKAKGRNK